jgi:hypothetical protein
MDKEQAPVGMKGSVIAGRNFIFPIAGDLDPKRPERLLFELSLEFFFAHGAKVPVPTGACQPHWPAVRRKAPVTDAGGGDREPAMRRSTVS